MEELEKVYVEFETMQRELIIWIDSTEDCLNECDLLSPEQQASDEEMEKFKV